MQDQNELNYDTRIINLLTRERYSLAEVIARYARANSVPLDEADSYIKDLIKNPISNLRIDTEEDSDEDATFFDQSPAIDSERAQVAAQTLLSTTAMLNTNIPSHPMQERLRRLAHAAVEDLERFYFGAEDDHHDHGHGHDHNHEHHHDHDDHDDHNHGHDHGHAHKKHNKHDHN
jgi:hypothetical protein